MALFDPALVNRALAAQGAVYRVPEVGPPPPPPPVGSVPPGALVSAGPEVDPIAAQNAALAAAQAEDAAMSGVGAAPESYAAPESSPYGMSPPAPAPKPEAVRTVDPVGVSSLPESELMSEPNASYPAEGPPPPPASRAGEGEAAPVAYARGATGGGGGGIANPIPGITARAKTKAAEAGAAAAGYEAKGDENLAEAQEAEKRRAAAEAQGHLETAAVQDRVAAEQEDYLRRLDMAQRAYDTAYKATSAKMAKLSDAIGAYEPTDRRSTMQKVAGSLAVATGVLLDQVNLMAGLNAGHAIQTNRAAVAVDLINRGIDRDLEMQRQMIENKRTAHAAKGTELGYIRTKFGDDVDTIKLGKVMKLDQAMAEMQAIKERALAKGAKATADGAIALMAQQRADLLADINRKTMEKEQAKAEGLEIQTYHSQQAARAAAANAPFKAAMQQLEFRGKLAEVQAKEREAGGKSTGEYGLEPVDPTIPATKESVEQAQKLASSFNGIVTTIEQLTDMARKGATMNPTQIAIAQRRLSSLRGDFNGTFGDGSAPSEAQIQEMKDMFANPTDVNLQDLVTVLGTFKQDAVDRANSKMRPYNRRLSVVDVRPE